MQQFVDYILQFQSLNEQQVDLIKSNLRVQQLEKGAYFSEAGKIARQIAFVKKRILRVCYYNKEGEEITRYFIDENNFAVDLNSFNAGIPSSEYIQAIMPTELYILGIEQLKMLSNIIVDWDQTVYKITNKALLDKVNRISPMMSENAKTRYLTFFERFPNLANRIPLNYLASYIGVTKHSLSRIRRELSL